MQVIQIVRDFVMGIPWNLSVIFCLTLGLAPFVPEPHLWEKLKMLSAGNLVRPIDWFDLVFHGAPWMLLILKIIFSMQGEGSEK